jgi:hypothetical protein
MNTFYTHSQLTKRSTTQLIAIYNRLFNTNIWDEVFNPYEARQEILITLFAEMRAQEVVAQMTDADRGAESYKAMKIVVSQDGMAVVWNTGEIKANNCKRSPEQMRLIRELAAQGETYQWIADALGIPKIAVFHVLKGVYALEPNRWNTQPETEKKPRRQPRSTFKAAKQKVSWADVVSSQRPQNEFWTNVGL